MGNLFFPIADGRIKLPGGDQELRTSTLVRHRPIHVKQEKRIDDDWNIDGSRDLSYPWTSYTRFIHWKKNLQTDFVVRVEINDKTIDIQARSFMARTLWQNEKVPS